MEFLKDYDCDIFDHPRKTNKVADALSRKSTITQVMVWECSLLEGIQHLEYKFDVNKLSNLLATLIIELELQSKIKALQQDDHELQKIREGVSKKKKVDF